LRERASESEGEIGERIGLARKQLAQAEEFDYVVVNDEIDRATQELEDIVQREVAMAGTMGRP
jgi:guanylate kinase